MHRLDIATARGRSEELLVTLGLAAALVHNPRLLVLDGPFESVDPVSGETIGLGRDDPGILHRRTAGGGTVIMPSHVMELVETLCDRVAVTAGGRLLAVGATADVRAGMPLQQRFLQLVGARRMDGGGLSWLDTSSGSD